jgi:hypothetical protein
MLTAGNNRFAVPALFLTLGTMLLLGTSAAAQMNGFHGGGIAPRGVPASVTSFGFGGHPVFTAFRPASHPLDSGDSLASAAFLLA